ncbi:HAD-like domain-containing protein, partial [Lactifluus volemus]
LSSIYGSLHVPSHISIKNEPFASKGKPRSSSMIKMGFGKKIEYVIFDVDGLMIDSERVYTDVTNEILAPYGAKMTWEIKAGLMGKTERPAAAHLLSFFPDIPLTIDDYLAQRTPLQNARWPHVQLLPGVERLVAHLAAHRIPIAIATSSVRRNFERKTVE